MFNETIDLPRHEIAFVFGQLLSPHSVPALLKVLQSSSESDMVRHEAAEALGGIATPEVLPYLKEHINKEDVPVVVRESCQVALDMYEVRVVSETLMFALLSYDRSMKTLTSFSMRMD